MELAWAPFMSPIFKLEDFSLLRSGCLILEIDPSTNPYFFTSLESSY